MNLVESQKTVERDSRMNSVHEVRAVVVTLQLLSFTAAASQLGLTVSAASKLVTRVEQRLGVRLLTRSTRRLALTPEGEIYLQRMQRVLADFEEAEAEVASSKASPQGPLRVTCPNFIFVRQLARILPAFLDRYPGIELQVLVSDRRLDLIADGIDVAIRLGTMNDSSLQARKLLELRRGLYASPKYLAAHGAPKNPDDLTQHSCLYSNQAPGLNVWPFVSRKGAYTVTVGSRLELNDALSVYEAAVAGLGIAQFSDLMVYPGLTTRELVPILGDHYDPTPTPMWVVMPPGRQRTARTSAFIDFCVEAFKSPPWRTAPPPLRSGRKSAPRRGGQ
jgi:DNA-binding transcriptional LysR family regulator